MRSKERFCRSGMASCCLLFEVGISPNPSVMFSDEAKIDTGNNYDDNGTVLRLSSCLFSVYSSPRLREKICTR